VCTIRGSGQCTILKPDQMWIQAIAIILPRVQRHYDSAPVPASPLTITHVVVPSSIRQPDRDTVFFNVCRNDDRGSGLGNLSVSLLSSPLAYLTPFN